MDASVLRVKKYTHVPDRTRRVRLRRRGVGRPWRTRRQRAIAVIMAFGRAGWFHI